MLPPAVIVHNRTDAERVASFAKPATLLSAEGAALYAGCLWWAALTAGLCDHGPVLLDCGDAPGRALEALKLGLKGLILSCNQSSFSIIEEIAHREGVLLLRERPPALDLGQRSAERHLATWLASEGRPDDNSKILG